MKDVHAYQNLCPRFLISILQVCINALRFLDIEAEVDQEEDEEEDEEDPQGALLCFLCHISL